MEGPAKLQVRTSTLSSDTSTVVFIIMSTGSTRVSQCFNLQYYFVFERIANNNSCFIPKGVPGRGVSI